MTQGERASLERLEDKFDRWAYRVETKIDGLDTRLRAVEMQAAKKQGEQAGGREVKAWGLQMMLAISAVVGCLAGIPAAIIAVRAGLG